MKIKKKKIKKMIKEAKKFRGLENTPYQSIRYYDGYIQVLESILQEAKK